MSWTKQKQIEWEAMKELAAERFNSLVAEYNDMAMKDPNNDVALASLDSQLQSTREQISRIAMDVKASMETLRVKAGSTEEPVRKLDEELNRLKLEEMRLQTRRVTREQQVDSLRNRKEQNHHTIGFFMLRPLAHQQIMIWITTVLTGLAGYLSYLTGQQFFANLGFTVPGAVTTTGRILAT